MKQLLSLFPILLLTGCNAASLAVKPVSEVNLQQFSYNSENHSIQVVDSRPEEEKSAGYVSEYFKGYRLGDTQLGFDRRLLVQDYLNSSLTTEHAQSVSLENFTLHHVEPEAVLVSTRKADDPDYALGVQTAVGGVLGVLLGEAIGASQTETHSNGSPYFLCTMKIRTQGKKVSIRYYLAQDYVSELNPEQPFESEKYRQGLRATINECLVRTADKLASSSRFSGFSLVQR